MTAASSEYEPRQVVLRDARVLFHSAMTWHAVAGRAPRGRSGTTWHHGARHVGSVTVAPKVTVGTDVSLTWVPLPLALRG